MGVDFTFRYQGKPGQDFEVSEASSEHFTSLFNCDAVLLRRQELWKSFIQEYHEGRQTFREWISAQTDEDWGEFMRQQTHQPHGPEENTMFWGPSAPFDPQEARDWAVTWSEILSKLEPQELQLLFPLDIDPQTRTSSFDTKVTLEALSQLVQQTDCAQRKGVQLAVDMILR